MSQPLTTRAVSRELLQVSSQLVLLLVFLLTTVIWDKLKTEEDTSVRAVAKSLLTHTEIKLAGQ